MLKRTPQSVPRPPIKVLRNTSSVRPWVGYSSKRSDMDLEPSDFANWDSLTRVAVDCHLDRGTVDVWGSEAPKVGIRNAQLLVRPFFIVGRSLQQRRKGNDDFRVRPVEGNYVEFQQRLLDMLIRAYHEVAPPGGAPRALFVPRTWRQKLISHAMVSARSGAALLFVQPQKGRDEPVMLFMGVPVYSEAQDRF